MAKVAVVTDSTADIPREERERLGIEMVPLKVHFGDEVYLDNIDLTPGQFYQKLRAFDGLPTTSQPSPGDFLEVYKRLAESGHAIVSIHLSSAMSGTYQSAQLARSMLPDADITVIDGRSVTYGLGMLVVGAAEAAAAGASSREVVERVLALRKAVRLYFLVDTLEYLHKGGRIGRAAALFGSLLNIKPILTIDDDGVISPVEKVRGAKKAITRIGERILADFPNRPLEVTLAVTPGFTETAQDLEGHLKGTLDIRRFRIAEIGPVVGTHAGPGAAGVFVLPA
jgi:DegV family protein with EDD domain